jgi:predicted nucleic-acid-binding Zn-ribbon protein
MTHLICPKCGGRLDQGKMQGLLQYISDNAESRFWSVGPEVRVSRASVCLSCGYIELYLDPEALKNKIGPS